MNLGLVEDPAGNEMAGGKFTVFVEDPLFLQGLRDVPGTLDLDGFVAATVKDPDIDALEVGDILDVGGSRQGNGGGKEIGLLVDEMPDTVATEGEPGEVDALGVSHLHLPEEVPEEREDGVSRAGHPGLTVIALRSNEDAGPLREVAHEGGGYRNLGLLDIVGPAFGRPVEIDDDRERGGRPELLRGIDLVDDISVRSAHPAVGKVLLVLSEEWVGVERENSGQGQQDQEEGMRGHFGQGEK